MSKIRLIDAEALKETIKDYISKVDGCAFEDDIFNCIDNAPTIADMRDAKQ